MPAPATSPEFSIIVPTLNESDGIVATLESLMAAIGATRLREGRCEIIVADSGSADDTVALAGLAGVRVVAGRASCRAEACNLGAAAARGRVLVFVDADTRMPAGFPDTIAAALRAPETVGGAFEFTLREAGLALRVIEVVNRLRYRIRRRYYGDQSLFVRAEDFRAVGGFPPRRILESSDLCRALERRGRLRLIRRPARTSARRFIEGGVWRVFGRDVWIWLLDTIGLPTDRFGRAYWAYNRDRNAR